MRSAKNIWMLTREYGDLAGAGGVKDVVDQLSRALATWSGRRVSVVLPYYGFLNAASAGFVPFEDPYFGGKALSYEVDMNYAYEERRESIQVWYKKSAKVHVYLLDSRRFREKGDIYTYTAREEEKDPLQRQGEGHYDYFAMNLLLQKGALQLMLLLQEIPDIIHCHDGHTAVLPAIIEETPWLRSTFRTTGCLVTVHNGGVGYHQEVSDLPYAKAMTGLPWNAVLRSRLRGSFDPLIAAGVYGAVNTVSENYARELQETADDEQTGWLGHHLLDMGTKLEGITNGVDPQAFDPAKGSELGLAAGFNPRSDDAMEGKSLCKKKFLEELTAKEPIDGIRQYGFLDRGDHCPLFTFIGRLSGQKGVDILHDTLLQMVKKYNDFQMVILGNGSAGIEKGLIALSEGSDSVGKVCFLAGYSTMLANRLYSAGDFFLVPSRYEPCGLTDFIAQLFGNIPIVHAVGGLVKVVDDKTGFTYQDNSPESLMQAMERALTAYGEHERIRTIQKNAVQLIEEKYTWQVVKNNYLQLYKKAIMEQTIR